MHLLLGIGNDLLGDDGIGPYIADNLIHPDWITINAGIVPENFIGPVKKQNPDRIVIVDAVEMGLSPGAIRLIPPDFISDCGIGTHQLSLTVIVNQLQSLCPDVMLIGIQPDSLNPDTALTDSVREAAEYLLKVISTNSLRNIKVFRNEEKKE